MGTSKLEVYNASLGHLGSRKLANLAENREPRRTLDDEWNQAVLYCLERGPWLFATRAVALAATPSVNPAFGFRFAVEKPTDWLRTVELCSDERFACPLRQFSDESGYWWTDLDAVFVRYVSTDPAWGLDLSKWSPTFVEHVSLRLARKTCKRITGSEEMLGTILKLEKQARLDARAADALNGPPAFPPAGSWSRARRMGGSEDRAGPRLIG